MKTVIMISITLILIGCGEATPTQSNTTPPQPTIGNSEVQPPASPTLE